MLFLRHYLICIPGALPLRDSVESTVAALIGMIPEGLYLLTSVAIAVSVPEAGAQSRAGAGYELH